MTITVVSAADGAPWEAVLLAELGRGHAEPPFRVVRRCVDIVELLAVAGSGQAVAALVDAQLRRLDADAVDRLAGRAVAVGGVTAPGAESDTERLGEGGIRFFVPSDASVDVFATVLGSAVADRAAPAGRRGENAFADPAFATGSLAGGSVGSPAAHSGSGQAATATGKADEE